MNITATQAGSLGSVNWFTQENIMKSQPQTTQKDMSFAALRSLAWQYKWRFIGADILRILSTICVAIHPYFFGQLAASSDDKERAFMFLLLLLFSGMLHGLIWNFDDYFIVKTINPLFYKIKHIAFTMFWDKDYTTFIEKPSGKVGYYINQLRTQTFELYDAYHYGFLPMFTSIPIYMYLLYTTAWQSSVIYTIFLVISLLTLIGLTRPLNKHQRTFTDHDSSNSGRVFDSYANFVNVFSFRAQHKEIARNEVQLEAVAKKFVSAEYRLINYWSTASVLIRFGLWSAILLYSWHMFDTDQISFAAFIVSVTVLLDFTQQFWNLVQQIGNWNRNSSTYKESYGYLFPGQNVVRDFYDDKRNFVNTTELELGSGLEIRNLSFAYPDAPDHPVLKNINIEVSKNEKIGIVGKSGSGKSTLIKILLGFYPLTDGEILVNGVDVETDDLSQLYAYVPQDTTLFQESIFYNIAYAREGEVSLEQVTQAAEKAHISEFINSLPHGYDTLVGERGVKLSLGQRQRIAIARAFLKQSELLILDEATSSLDSRTESYVQQSFEKLWGNKAVIAIAHRLSTLNNVDRIIVMSKGEIIEEGTKEELLALDGVFADLWNHQRKGMI